MKILLLEDETMLRSSIKEFLEELECEVSEYGDGQGAFEALKTQEFDLFLLDIGTPVKDGFEVMAEIKKLKLQKPVIFITASTDIEEISRAYSLGCADYLKKPFKLQELWLRIQQIFRLMGQTDSVVVQLCDCYRYDKKRRALFCDGEQLQLSPRHLSIIELLVSNLDYCVDFDRFRDVVWHRGDIDDATIRAEVGRMRKLFRTELVKNVKGLGYKIEKHRPQ